MSEQKEINESLYSRQLYVLGHETMRKMADSNVLIIGLGGLGVEVAKNVILTGVKSVTLYDNQLCAMSDLSSQFYLSEKDVGVVTRAEASVKHLADLNQYVSVSVMSDTITQEKLSAFTVAVFTDHRSLKSAIAFNALCREASCKFILAEQSGLYGFIFVDCGSEHIVSDVNGEPATSNLISTIESGKTTTITVDDSTRLNLDDGGGHADHADRVTFTEVDGSDGMPGMNDLPPQRVKITGPYTLELVDLDSTYMGKHLMGSGYLHQAKPNIKMNFLSLAESLEAPEFLITDYSKLDTVQLHLLMQATSQFAETHDGKLPTPVDIDELLKLADQINQEKSEKSISRVEKLDTVLLTALGRLTPGTLQPLAAALGGIISQEVLKACSSKFTPIRQWCYLDIRELLMTGENKELVSQSDADLAPIGNRYDGLRAVIGSTLVQQLHDSSTFLVGAGAVGCEIIKNITMMGVAGGKDGSGVLHVTDMDTIETSNLSRQFLYRNSDVEKHKSDTAAVAVKSFNPEIRTKSYQMRVGQETEETFNDAFFQSLNFVINALDNVQARLYMDSQCIYYKLPLLESGTLGLKGNTQVVVPSLTESYGSSRDPPEKSIPQCLLHHFPNRIEHTIQWARDQFDGDFTLMPSQVNAFLDDPKAFIDNLRNQPGRGKVEQLLVIKNALIDQKPKTFADCVSWARMQLETNFNHKIQQLLFNFPLDQITSQGTPFWSGLKRAPTPLSYNDESVNKLALNFIIASAMMKAEVFQLADRPTTRDESLLTSVAKMASNVMVPEFKPQRGVQIKSDEKEENDENEKEYDVNDDSEFDDLVKMLVPLAADQAHLVSVEFEKDDETNWHMDFVTACSNMRASNYKIGLADMHKTKLIAGKIIPAMITTTALVSGLVCVELLKIMTQRQNKRTIEHYRNTFCNLALPFITTSEPIAPQKTEIRAGVSWNLWDEFLIDQGAMTLRQLIDYFSEKHQLEISMLSGGVTLIYSFFMNKEKLQGRMDRELSELFSEITKTPLPVNKDHLTFEVVCTREEDDEDVDVPPIKYKFKNFSS